MSKQKHDVTSYLDYLYKLDYEERPVDFEQFVRDPAFIGKITKGGKALYNVWKDELKAFTSEDSLLIMILTGGIGTGKTTAAVIGMSYVMHRILCLKSPWDYFNLASGGKMAIAFFNLTRTLSSSRGYGTLHDYLASSSWFKDRASHVYEKKDRTIVEFALFEYVLASPYSSGFGVVGSNVILGLLDEVDDPSESPAMRTRIASMFEATLRRFESRFVVDNESLGSLFIAASKQQVSSFLSALIVDMKNSKRVYIVDIPLWKAKPQANYSGETFYVHLGDTHTVPKIINADEVSKSDVRTGIVIEVPVEHEEAFERDIIGALRDIAGQSSSQIRKYKLFSSIQFIEDCYDKEKFDPIKSPLIKTGLKDKVDLIKHFDLSKIRVPRHVPRYIHMDIAFAGAGDALGLGMSCIRGIKEVETQQEDGTFTLEKMPIAETDFAAKIVAEPGDEVPIHKIRKLVLDLRRAGFNIAKFTADLRLASADTSQILQDRGITCEYVSLDKKSEPYNLYRNMVLEQRWICHRHGYLHFELTNLEYNRDKDKIDHPDKVVELVMDDTGNMKEIVLKGSKDVSDGVVGSVYMAVKDYKIPVDSKAMKNIMDNLTKETKEELDPYWWISDIMTSAKSDKEEDIKETDDKVMDKFANLIKRM